MITISQVIAFISEGRFKCSLSPQREKFDDQYPRSCSFNYHVMVLIKSAVGRVRALSCSTCSCLMSKILCKTLRNIVQKHTNCD